MARVATVGSIPSTGPVATERPAAAPEGPRRRMHLQSALSRLLTRRCGTILGGANHTRHRTRCNIYT